MTTKKEINDIVRAARNLRSALHSIHDTVCDTERAVFAAGIGDNTEKIFDMWSDCNYHIDALTTLVADIVLESERARLRLEDQ